MATIKAFIRTIKKSNNNKVAVRFRLSAGRGKQLFYVSDIFVHPGQWRAKKQAVNENSVVDKEENKSINKKINSTKAMLLDAYDNMIGEVTSEAFSEAINRVQHPEQYKPKEITFFDRYNEFIKDKPSVQTAHLAVLRRCLQRWEMYRQITENTKYQININTLTDTDLQAFEDFLENEHSFFDKYPNIYATIKDTRKPKPRGNNARSNILKRFRTFYIWAVKKGYTTNNPFKDYSIDDCIYGTPYIITIDERKHLLDTDMSDHPETAVQRDIFVLQCMIGCRVSDLHKLTEANLKDNGTYLEYIARKTKKKEPVTVRVPLTATARELIEKYRGVDKAGRLMPFISDQKYNKQIKKAFKLAELTRAVTVINPTTGEEQQLPLDAIASSHLARRAFIGNIYRKVKDPNLVGKLSGHVEGSRAFARYRHIDDKIKEETINLLE